MDRMRLLLAAASVSMGCSSAASDPPAATGGGAMAELGVSAAAPVIMRLVTRDAILVVHGGQEQVRFSVEDRRGRPVATTPLSSAQLQQNHRDLFEIYRDGFARGGPYLDARVDAARPHRPER